MYCRILHTAAFVRPLLVSDRKVHPTISEVDDDSSATNPANVTDSGEDSDSDRPSKAASRLDSPCMFLGSLLCRFCRVRFQVSHWSPYRQCSLPLGICHPSTHKPWNRHEPSESVHAVPTFNVLKYLATWGRVGVKGSVCANGGSVCT